MAFFIKNVTSLNGLYFCYMHVSDADSNKFCKFHKIWRTFWECVKIVPYLKGSGLTAFFCKKNNFSEWDKIPHACLRIWFQQILQVSGNFEDFEKV